ncbi:ets DNA-binding protein pokkuri [Bicyclus anynana]|uniref:Ets DNA-binding protein pokkuri n=1 Tax=Bicyclus anynana TaxID=110368 RepID=A0ABM3LJ45_BICAN|nr:ets DNA-binding protein pokkuri [Bicyclus anynana]
MPAPAPCERRAVGADAAHAWADAWAAADADALPLDPRQWTRRDVGAWAARRGARPERFPMNGKALCLMSGAMFAAREPACGAALHREFRRRLAKALALQQLLDALAAP